MTRVLTDAVDERPIDREWWRDVVVVTHHPLDEVRGGVTESLRTLAADAGIEWRWTLTDAPSREAFNAPLTLFNGAFSLNSRGARDVLAHRAARGLPSIVYWHEVGARQRRLQGIDVQPDKVGKARRKAWPQLCGLLLGPQVWHFAAALAVKSSLVGSVGVDPRRIFVIYNALPEITHRRRRARPTDELRVCTTGINDPNKNSAGFVELAQSWDAALLPAVWTWYGTGEIAEASPDVVTPGVHRPLSEALVDHDVYVSMAIEEPFGIAGLEALAVGLPVIAVQSHGLAEFLPRSWQVHCEQEVPAVLAQWLAGDWPDAESCRAIAAEFTPAKFEGRIVQALQHFLEPGWQSNDAAGLA